MPPNLNILPRYLKLYDFKMFWKCNVLSVSIIKKGSKLCHCPIKQLTVLHTLARIFRNNWCPSFHSLAFTACTSTFFLFWHSSRRNLPCHVYWNKVKIEYKGFNQAWLAILLGVETGFLNYQRHKWSFGYCYKLLQPKMLLKYHPWCCMNSNKTKINVKICTTFWTPL